MPKILFVEDSDESQLVVSRAFAGSNIKLFTAQSAQETRELIKASGLDFDLVLLDLGLPDADGFSVLEWLRTTGMSKTTPVFFLTSETELDSKVTAFNLGADDYLLKPISPIELRARVEMRLRKANPAPVDTISRGDLKIELSILRASCVVDGKLTDLSLTAKEFKILAFLVQSENKVFARTELVEGVWGKGIHILDRTVDSHIYGLRKKMSSIAHYVECIPNAGYRFRLPDKNSATG